MRPILVVLFITVFVMTACSQDDSATLTDVEVSTTVDEGTAAIAGDTETPISPTPSDTTTSTVDAASDSTDPRGLSGIEMPVTQTEVTRVLVGMPDDIDGMKAIRDEDTDHVGFVLYERAADEWIKIFWSEIGFDAASAVDTLQTVSQNDIFTIESSRLKAAEDFVWLEGFATEPDRIVYLAYFGNPAGGWLFLMEADSIEHRAAGMEAFTASATS